ncbi:MAG: hypothetical protein QOF85_955 [Solirubrobacterales bacterium]|jgi:hypothetical protein|nr:hypothetical protein [Solirubrobacterales bacterium]
MIAARHRFPSRGSFAAPTAARGRAEGPMLTAPPPEEARGRPSRLQGGEFAPGAKPVQDLIGTGVRELFTSMLDAATAVRLGDNSARPRYFGTVLPQPQVWRTPSDLNAEDSIRAGMINAGNAPEMANKSASSGGPPRIAASLPVRGR